MNTQAPTEDRKTLDQEVERVLKQMSTMSVDTEEYRLAVENLKVLCEARGIKSHRALSTDTVVTAATNILGIILVLNFERLNVITSKAMSFVFKGSRG